MSCLGWNCRGIGNAATVRELSVLLRTHSSQLVFLCETRQKSDRVRRLRHRLGLRGFFGVDSEGMSGGLALFWHETIYVDIKDSSLRFIDAHIRLGQGQPLFHVTFFYGEPRVENRHRMWSLLSTLRATSSLPWLVLRDFNEALWQYEHFSACLRSEPQMAAFRDCLQVCELKDVGFSGLPFTYDNKRAGNSNVRVRLDRVVADNS
jgi:hypothetical protein